MTPHVTADGRHETWREREQKGCENIRKERDPPFWTFSLGKQTEHWVP
jgi:hypothetical protein